MKKIVWLATLLVGIGLDSFAQGANDFTDEQLFRVDLGCTLGTTAAIISANIVYNKQKVDGKSREDVAASFSQNVEDTLEKIRLIRKENPESNELDMPVQIFHACMQRRDNKELPPVPVQGSVRAVEVCIKEAALAQYFADRKQEGMDMEDALKLAIDRFASTLNVDYNRVTGILRKVYSQESFYHNVEYMFGKLFSCKRQYQLSYRNTSDKAITDMMNGRGNAR